MIHVTIRKYDRRKDGKLICSSNWNQTDLSTWGEVEKYVKETLKNLARNYCRKTYCPTPGNFVLDFKLNEGSYRKFVYKDEGEKYVREFAFSCYAQLFML